MPNTTSSRLSACSSIAASASSSTSQVERILKKRIYQNKVYYHIKWSVTGETTWILAADCPSAEHIEQYERDHLSDEDEDEWEVEKIIDKRVRRDQVEYLVKWKDWPGDPSWEIAENCSCINLIAAFENPKLKRLWDFKESNETLWLGRKEMLKYMKFYINSTKTKVNLLRFQPDFPKEEEQFDLNVGLNIGPLVYENHWYLVVILIQHICISRLILVGDSLNTLIGTRKNEHPVIKRLKAVYKHFPIRPIAITQMDRSDICAYYALAAFERSLFLFNSNASMIADSIFFDPLRAELIRSELRPDTNGELSVALPIPSAFDHGPICEFCKELYETRTEVDEHICFRHMHNPTKITIKTKVKSSSTGDLSPLQRRIKRE